jgi:ubiquinone/menaquinone biosynthesis C-methylase UbiE
MTSDGDSASDSGGLANAAQDPKARIGSIWDSAAPEYDGCWGHGLRTPEEKRAWSALLSELLAPVPPARVLDVGCGSGFLALLLAEAGHAVVGLDLSAGMLAVARREAGRRGLELPLVRADAERPPAAAARFDAVVCRHLLWTLTDPLLAVRAWSALLVPGGRIFAIDAFWPSAPLSRRISGCAGRLLGRLTRGNGGGGYPAELAERLPLHHLPGPGPVREVFLQAGLADVSVRPLTEIDRVERTVMPLSLRLQTQSSRHLIMGRRPAIR